MDEFEQYLSNKFTVKTVSTYCYLVGQFLTYKETVESEETADYNQILKYITVLRRTNSDTSINLHLIALRHYFNFKNVKYNPVKLHLKRKPLLLSTKCLSEQQLIEIYDSYQCDTVAQKRNKVLLGLFVFQGIRSSEVKLLKADHINLHKMTIEIPKTLKSNQRILPLHIKQILLLSEYATGIIDSNITKHPLITTSKNKNCIRSILDQLNKKLRYLPFQTNLRLLRTCVIRNWLKTNDLRTVQYYAGHKYISSTETYMSKDLEHLKKCVIKFHPL